MLNFFFGFHGRVRRSHYFFGAIVACFVYSLLALTGLAALDIHVMDGLNGDSVDVHGSPLFAAIEAVVGVVALWSLLALTVKRWHDVGLTGWFSILTLPPFANGVVFLLMCLLPGTTGANRFGSDPRGRPATGSDLAAA